MKKIISTFLLAIAFAACSNDEKDVSYNVKPPNSRQLNQLHWLSFITNKGDMLPFDKHKFQILRIYTSHIGSRSIDMIDFCCPTTTNFEEEYWFKYYNVRGFYSYYYERGIVTFTFNRADVRFTESILLFD